MSNRLNDLLLAAAANGHDVEQMQSILQNEKGIIDLNIRDSDDCIYSRTILHKACCCDEKEGSYLELVELLLAHGADVNSRDNCGGTPLHDACKTGNIQMVKLLIDNHAEIDSKTNHSGCTPLLWACCYGHADVVRLLLKNNADIESKDSSGHPLLYWAYRQRQVDVVRVLLENNATMFVDRRGQSLLHNASEEGNAAMAQLLIDANANINIQDIYGYTPLHFACLIGHTHIVRLLLRNGANMTIKTWDDKTPEDLARDDEIVAIIHNFRERRQQSFAWMKRRRQIKPRSF